MHFQNVHSAVRVDQIAKLRATSAFMRMHGVSKVPFSSVTHNVCSHLSNLILWCLTVNVTTVKSRAGLKHMVVNK